MKWLMTLETKLTLWLCQRYYKRHGYCISYIKDTDTSQYLIYTEDADVYSIMDKFFKNFDRYGIYMYDKDSLYTQYMRVQS